VIAGYSTGEYAVARLMPDGSLDPSFDGDSGAGNGIVKTPMTPSFDQPSGVAVDKLGRIVVAGTAGGDDVGVARYLSDGKLDKSLAGDGTLIDLTPTEDVMALAIVGGGLLVAGENAPMTRSSTATPTAERSTRATPRLARIVKLTRSSRAGGNRVRFSGRVGRRTLRPGRYRATLTAVDQAGGRSKPSALTFRIVRS
jgi:hypothetical protein